MKKTPIQQLCELLGEFLENDPTTPHDPHLDRALLIGQLLRQYKRNQFEFDELVEVRNWNDDKWEKRNYVGSVITANDRVEYLTYKLGQSARWHRNRDYKSWYQIRKIQR